MLSFPPFFLFPVNVTHNGCYHLCYHLMLSFFVIISPLFSFSCKRDTLTNKPSRTIQKFLFTMTSLNTADEVFRIYGIVSNSVTHFSEFPSWLYRAEKYLWNFNHFSTDMQIPVRFKGTIFSHLPIHDFLVQCFCLILL